MMAQMIAGDVEASCAICGAPAYPECPHEGDRLKLALNQAMARWAGLQEIRDWVLNNARNQVIATFHQLREARRHQYLNYLSSIPCYTLYQRHPINPPIAREQLHFLQSQIEATNARFKAGVDEDWRRSCLTYPEVLDYYFSLVGFDFPDDQDPDMLDPRFGAPRKETRRLGGRRGSLDTESTRKPRKKDRRRSRGETPPAAPEAGHFWRRG